MPQSGMFSSLRKTRREAGFHVAIRTLDTPNRHLASTIKARYLAATLLGAVLVFLVKRTSFVLFLFTSHEENTKRINREGTSSRSRTAALVVEVNEGRFSLPSSFTREGCPPVAVGWSCSFSGIVCLSRVKQGVLGG